MDKKILISDKEQFVVQVMRMNESIFNKEIRKKVKFGKLKIEFIWKSRKNLWGRFGGGWNWKLGFQIGGSTIIISILICELHFRYKGGS